MAKTEREEHSGRPRPLSHLKAKWRDQLCADNELRPAAFKVGYVMADYMTMTKTANQYIETGEIIIYPSYEELGKKTGFCLDTIGTSVTQLIDHGHLQKQKRGNQFSGSNRYRIIIMRQPSRAQIASPSIQEISGMHSRKIRDATPEKAGANLY